jgi:hypothetical protein
MMLLRPIHLTFHNAEKVDKKVLEDSCILHRVVRLQSGRLKGEFRYMSRIVVDGEEYEVDKCFYVSFRKVKKGKKKR